MKRSALLLLLPLLTLAVAPAQAREELESPKYLNAGWAFGGLWLQSDAVQQVYGKAGKFMPKLQIGAVPWSQYAHVEVNFGFSYVAPGGAQIFLDGDGAGSSSADEITLNVFAMNLDLLVGLDLVYEQPVVPYGGVGIVWAPWREHDAGSTEYRGVKLGGNVFFGGAILLDWIERERASRVDASTGINDAFLTIEGRYTKANSALVDGQLKSTGLDLSSWALLVGIKLVI